MRVLPHALFLADTGDEQKLVHDVVLDGVATHGHPRALVGAAVYAYAAWVLARKRDTIGFGELLDVLLDERRRWSELPGRKGAEDSWFRAADTMLGGRYEEVWSQTAGEMGALLELARHGVRDGALADDSAVLRDLGCFSSERGSGTRSAAAAVYLATRHAAQPVRGVFTAAFAKGADTDTLAAMTGGLCGCLSGTDWIPASWLQVQDASYIRGVARQVSQGDSAASDGGVVAVGDPEIKKLRGRIVGVDGEAEILFGNMGRARVKGPTSLRTSFRKLEAQRWRLDVLDGQTLYVSKAAWESRAPRAAPPQVEQQTAQRADSRGSMYSAFCSHLIQVLRVSGPLRPTEIADVMGLLVTQTRKWLEQAEGEGKIRRTSKSPARFDLSERSLL